MATHRPIALILVFREMLEMALLGSGANRVRQNGMTRESGHFASGPPATPTVGYVRAPAVPELAARAIDSSNGTA